MRFREKETGNVVEGWDIKDGWRILLGYACEKSSCCTECPLAGGMYGNSENPWNDCSDIIDNEEHIRFACEKSGFTIDEPATITAQINMECRLANQTEHYADDQKVKADNGKLKVTLAPTDLVETVAVIREYEERQENDNVPVLIAKTEKRKGSWYGIFRCQYCGKEFEACISNVTSGRQRSCGCMKGKFSVETKGTHGDSKTRLYRMYRHIVERCNSPKCKEYKWYGGRGIRCEFESYEDFKEFALQHGYNDELSCERIDVNGNYSPSNIMFIPLELQARNTRSNVRIEYKGLVMCAAEWAELFNFHPDTLTARKRRGWSDEKTLETPAGDSIDVSLVPIEAIKAIREVRLYGIKKYGEVENWRNVSEERYQNAAYRHWLAYLEDPDGVDAESGLPHLWHLACNVAFLVTKRWKKHSEIAKVKKHGTEKA